MKLNQSVQTYHRPGTICSHRGQMLLDASQCRARVQMGPQEQMGHWLVLPSRSLTKQCLMMLPPHPPISGFLFSLHTLTTVSAFQAQGFPTGPWESTRIHFAFTRIIPFKGQLEWGEAVASPGHMGLSLRPPDPGPCACVLPWCKDETPYPHPSCPGVSSQQGWVEGAWTHSLCL